MSSSTTQEKALVTRISAVSVAVNLLLSVLKAVAGVAAHSGAMVSDAVHSASDVFSTFIVYIGYNASQKAGDKEHPYGHERLECVAAIVLATVLIVVGIEIGWGGVRKIIGGAEGGLAVPGALALWAAVISIIVKEAMFWYTRWGAKKVDSGALMADAWHHRSDALSSVGSFIGIFGARLGFPILDPIASVVICVFILKAGADIFRDALDKMVDKACDEETVAGLKDCVRCVPGVRAIDMIRTRVFGAKSYVDIEIAVDGDLSVTEAHTIAENVHDRIEADFPKVKHCMVHVNPLGAHSDERGEEGEWNEYDCR
ncbi:MAG: cation diffusion facilitator family transporter [Bacillota bacterium]|jgi:cation diffusion facilitator family transporter